MKNIRTYAVNTDVYRTLKKIRLEEDSSLPDYCSDIMKVIKVESFPVLYSKKTAVRDGMLTCDVSGCTVFNVVYLTDGGSAESYSFTSEFTDTLKTEVSEIDEDSVYAFVLPSSENTSCRVQSPRRISVSTVISLDTDITANRGFTCYTAGDNSVEAIERSVGAVRAVCSKDGEFRLSEEIRLPKSCPPMERILSCTASVYPESAASGDNKVSFWGNAGISCAYIPEESTDINSFYQPLDIKGSLEVEDSRGDMIASVKLVPSSFSFEILADNLGENRILKVELVYKAQCLVTENVSIELTEDIYGVGCAVTPQYDRSELRRYVGTLKEDTAIKETISVKKDVKRLEGTAATVFFKNTYFENGELYADCRVNISAIGVTDDSLCHVNEDLDLSIHLNLPSDVAALNGGTSFDVSMQTGFADTRIDDSGMTVAFDITTVARIFHSESIGYVASAEIGERTVRGGEMIFCYPSDADTLWTVGKRYGVSTSALAAANSVTASDKLKRVMVIPRLSEQQH